MRKRTDRRHLAGIGVDDDSLGPRIGRIDESDDGGRLHDDASPWVLLTPGQPSINESVTAPSTSIDPAREHEVRNDHGAPFVRNQRSARRARRNNSGRRGGVMVIILPNVAALTGPSPAGRLVHGIKSHRNELASPSLGVCEELPSRSKPTRRRSK